MLPLYFLVIYSKVSKKTNKDNNLFIILQLNLYGTDFLNINESVERVWKPGR